MQGDVLKKKLQYWLSNLEGVEVLNLPTDFPRPKVQQIKGDRFTFHIMKGLTEGINELCQQEKVTLFMFLLGVYKVMLSKYSGQNGH